MKYKVTYKRKTMKSLSNLDKGQQVIIWAWIEKNLVGTNDPRAHGKALKGDFKEYWRYRVGEYRILAEIDDNQIIIIIVNVGHRKNLYT